MTKPDRCTQPPCHEQKQWVRCCLHFTRRYMSMNVHPPWAMPPLQSSVCDWRGVRRRVERRQPILGGRRVRHQPDHRHLRRRADNRCHRALSVCTCPQGCWRYVTHVLAFQHLCPQPAITRLARCPVTAQEALVAAVCLARELLLSMQRCPPMISCSRVHTADQHLHQSLGQVPDAAVPAVGPVHGDRAAGTQRRLPGPGRPPCSSKPSVSACCGTPHHCGHGYACCSCHFHARRSALTA